MKERLVHKNLSKNTVRLLLLMAAAAVGAAAGALSGTDMFFEDTASFIAAYRKLSPPGLTAWTSLKGLIILTAVCFLLGFSAVGAPLEICVPFFYGVGFGAAAGGMIRTGCGTELVRFIPGGLIAVFTVALAARESLRMSGAVFRRTFLPDEYTPADVALYVKKFFIIIIFGIFAAAADCIAAIVF